jgi:protein-tyrosine phosphatase
MSPYTLKALEAHNISCPQPLRDPLHCFERDLQAADLVIALKETEHRPLLAKHFPGWEERVEYWHVHDLDGATPDKALGEIEVLVRQLVERISS